MRVAAIDIGTVTCRLLVADADPSTRKTVPLVREAVITNLGEGVDASGMLREDAMDRTVAQVACYKRIIDGFADTEEPVGAVVAVATSASRDASNAADFVSRLAQIGVELTVIPGQREAELSFAGAAGGFTDEQLLVVDIGGGSTEVIAGRAHSGAGSPIGISDRRSFDVGCRRMTERFLQSDPPSPEELERARAWALDQMSEWIAGLPHAERLVAVAGTATTAVSIREAMVTYDPDLVHGAVVTRDELRSIYDRLRVLPLAQRREIPGLQPQRASVIVAGFLILDAVLEAAGCDSFTVSEHDILQGIVLDAASKAPVPDSLA